MLDKGYLEMSFVSMPLTYNVYTSPDAPESCEVFQKTCLSDHHFLPKCQALAPPYSSEAE